MIERFEEWIEKEVSNPSHDWEYADGTNMGKDARAFLKRYRDMGRALAIIRTWAATAQDWDEEQRLGILKTIQEKCDEVLKGREI